MRPKDGIGPMRHLLSYETRTVDYNALREPTETWAAASSWRAAKRPAGGREAINAQQLQTQVEFVITTRHPGRGSEFSPEGRFVDSLTSEIFNITHVFDPDDRGRYLACYCTRTASGGAE